jgi:hypothetical protein
MSPSSTGCRDPLPGALALTAEVVRTWQELEGVVVDGAGCGRVSSR